MKKYSFFLAALLCMMVSTVCHADDYMVAPAQLPAPVKNFVTQHFKGKSIAYAELDREFAGGKYELHLNDGTELNFDRRGNWDKVDCHMMPVPAALVPAPIANYVKANYAGSKVSKIDKERYGYDIELTNGIELKFNKAGNLIGMDWDD